MNRSPLAQHVAEVGGSHTEPTRHRFTAEAVGVAEEEQRGQVVGEGQKRGSYKLPYHAVLWQKGKPADLGTLQGRTESTAVAVNNRGMVIGSSLDRVDEYGERKARMRAFFWQKGKVLDLRTVAGLPHSSAVALNERGQVIGWRAKALEEDEDLPKSPRAFLWQDGELTVLGNSG